MRTAKALIRLNRMVSMVTNRSSVGTDDQAKEVKMHVMQTFLWFPTCFRNSICDNGFSDIFQMLVCTREPAILKDSPGTMLVNMFVHVRMLRLAAISAYQSKLSESIQWR